MPVACVLAYESCAGAKEWFRAEHHADGQGLSLAKGQHLHKLSVALLQGNLQQPTRSVTAAHLPDAPIEGAYRCRHGQVGAQPRLRHLNPELQTWMSSRVSLGQLSHRCARRNT